MIFFSKNSRTEIRPPIGFPRIITRISPASHSSMTNGNLKYWLVNGVEINGLNFSTIDDWQIPYIRRYGFE